MDRKEASEQKGKEPAFIFKVLMLHLRSCIRYSSFSTLCLREELKSFANSLADDMPKISAILAESIKDCGKEKTV